MSIPGDLGPDLTHAARVSPLGIATIVVGSGMAIGIAFLTSRLARRRRHEEDLKRSFALLLALTGRVQGAREDERKAVAREIHDELGQALTSLKIDLSALVRDAPRSRAQSKRAESMLRLLDATIQSARRLATQLRPSILDHLGLAAAIEWAAAEFEERTGVNCEFQLPQTEFPTSSEQVTALFRIFQETLTNITRHAHATRVKVRLYADNGAMCLQVEDNGRGMDPSPLFDTHALGIVGMQERALLLGGEVTIRSWRGAGTIVDVRIPAVEIQS